MALFGRTKRRERGAILVLTSIGMIALMGFSAFAIDIGQRNQELARAQHSIDAAVLGAAQHLSAYPGDYAGASTVVKELVAQNLGIAATAWTGCSDPEALEISAPGDTTCISFKRKDDAVTGQVKHDIRVRLPEFKMDTIFGSALGIDTIDLAAAAASNGDNCGGGEANCQQEGSTTTVAAAGPTSTTTPAPSTTQSEKDKCIWREAWSFLYTPAEWATCQVYFPGVDYDKIATLLCTDLNPKYDWNGSPRELVLSEWHHWTWWWAGGCENWGDHQARDKWIDGICFAKDRTLIYYDYYVYLECKTRRPSIDDWNQYYSTTTTTTTTTIKPAPTTAPPSTTAAPPTTRPKVSVPATIDISG